MERIPIADTFIGEEEAKAAYDVIKSGWVSSGKKVKELEKNFAEYVHAKHALAANNGTAALHVVLAALGIKQGDEVIVPSLTFCSTANAVLYQNAVPVLAECDPKTFNVSVDEIKKRITKKTKAIIPVDMNGMPVDYDVMLELSEEKGIPVVFDSAESLGAEYKKKKVGGIAPVHIFSFFPNKNMTTGEGGMITCSDAELAEKISILINQGQEGRYNHTHLGFNYRMNDIQAAVGVEQLKRVPWVVKQKQRVAERYTEAFNNHPKIKAPFLPDYVAQHSWYMYAISVPIKMRDELVKQLYDAGIDTRLSFPPIHNQPYYRQRFGYTNDSFPVTKDTWAGLIDIPIWAKLRQEQQEYVITTLKKLCV